MLFGLFESKQETEAIDSYVSLLVDGCLNNRLSSRLTKRANQIADDNHLTNSQLVDAQNRAFSIAWSTGTILTSEL